MGDASAQELLAEVLLMTKMNWNSARFAEKLPVTVRFANEVGTILRDLPEDYTPEARYAFYMRGVAVPADRQYCTMRIKDSPADLPFFRRSVAPDATG